MFGPGTTPCNSMVEDTQFRRTVTVNLKDGLHLRPISQIVETVRRYGSPVRISKGDLTADAGNVLDLIPLRIEFGSILVLEASGEKAAETLDALVALFESNFEDAPSPDE
jgi:phosphotransferase system HPr (HPr) family protein